MLRSVIVASGANPPWERCARRAVTLLVDDLLALGDNKASTKGGERRGRRGRPPFQRAQHLAAQRRAEALAPHADPAAVLHELGLEPRDIDPEQWRQALSAAVKARSREQLARILERELGDAEPRDD